MLSMRTSLDSINGVLIRLYSRLSLLPSSALCCYAISAVLTILIMGAHTQCNIGRCYPQLQPGEQKPRQVEHFAASSLIITTAGCFEIVQLVAQRGLIRMDGRKMMPEGNALVEPLAMVTCAVPECTCTCVMTHVVHASPCRCSCISHSYSSTHPLMTHIVHAPLCRCSCISHSCSSTCPWRLARSALCTWTHSPIDLCTRSATSSGKLQSRC